MSGAALALCGSMTVYADVVPANGSTVSKVGSVTVIDILSPDDKGHSYNRFSSFDALGVVLNNAQNNSESRLVGGVKRNAALAGAAARSIIIDNIGDAPTRLNGLVEIVGSRADLLIAGRNGIVCNSCGFINTRRLTLGAGELERDASGAFRLSVETGHGGISVSGAGLSAPDSDINLVAQQIELLAPVYGKDVAFRIVRGLYGIEDGRSESLGEAFDATLGDYVGVPNVLANGDITVYTDARRLDMKNLTMSATGGIELRSRDGAIDVVSAKLIANDALSLQGEALTLKKTATDSGRVALKAGNLESYGWFAVADDIALQAGRTALQASSFDARTQFRLNGDDVALLSVNLKGDADIRAPSLSARALNAEGGQARFASAAMQTEGGALRYRKLDVEGFETLAFDATLLRVDALALQPAHQAATLRLGAGSSLTTRRLALQDMASLDNQGEVLLLEDMALSGLQEIRNGGRIVAASLAVQGTAALPAVLRNAGRWHIQGRAGLTNLATLSNSGEMRAAALDLDNTRLSTAQLAAARLENDGELALGGDLRLTGLGAVVNTRRVQAANGVVDMRGAGTASRVDNRGEIALRGNLDLFGVTRLDNPGSVQADALTLDNRGETAELRNRTSFDSQGTLRLRETLRLLGLGSFVNRGEIEAGALIQAPGEPADGLTGLALFDNAGQITLRDALQLASASRVQNGGMLQAQSLLLDNGAQPQPWRQAAVFENKGTLGLSGLLQLRGVGRISNRNVIQADGLSVDQGDGHVGAGGSASLENVGDIALGGGASLRDMARIDNSGGWQAASLQVDNATGGLHNSGNLKVAQVGLRQVGASSNTGRWSSQSATLSQSGVLTNRADLDIGALQLNQTSLDNEGRLKSGQVSVAQAGRLLNGTGGQWVTRERLQVQNVAQWRNQGRLVAGELQADGVTLFENEAEMALTRGGRWQGDTFTSSRSLYSQGDLSLQAKTLALSGSLQGRQMTATAASATLRDLNASLTGFELAASGSAQLQQARVQASAQVALTTPSLTLADSSLHAPLLRAQAGTQQYGNTDLRADAVLMTGQGAESTAQFNNVRLHAEKTLALSALKSAALSQAQWAGGSLSVSDVGTLTTSSDTVLAFSTASLARLASLAHEGVLDAGALALSDIASLRNQGRLVGRSSARLERLASLQNLGDILAVGVAGEGNGTFDNRGTVAVRGGDVSFTRWENQGKLLAADATLGYAQFVNAAGGEVGGLGSLTLRGAAASQWQNQGQVQAKGNLDLYGQTLQNAGALTLSGNLTLGRQAGDVAGPAVSFQNQSGVGAVTVGGNLVARVDHFDSKASFEVERLNSNNTEYAERGTYGSCLGSGHGSCRDNFNAAGNKTVVWYGSGGVIPVYGLAGRNGADVTTTTTQIRSGTYRDAPIKVGGDLSATGQGRDSYFDTYGATLETGGRSHFDGYARRNTNGFVATRREQKTYFTDLYYCWSDVACVNSSGNNTYKGREGSYDKRSPTDQTANVSTTGGLATRSLAAVPALSVVLPETAAPVPGVPGDTTVALDLSRSLESAAVPAALVATGLLTGGHVRPLERVRPGAAPIPTAPPLRPAAGVADPGPAQEALRVRASDFLFPAIPGELSEAEKLPVVSDDEEAAFDVIDPLRARQDVDNRSCYSVTQGEDATSLGNVTPRLGAECELRVIYPVRSAGLSRP